MKIKSYFDDRPIKLDYLKKLGITFLVWPLDLEASDKRVLVTDIIWIMIYLNYIVYFIGTSIIFYQTKIHGVLTLSVGLQFVFSIDVLTLLTVYRWQRPRLQVKILH